MPRASANDATSERARTQCHHQCDVAHDTTQQPTVIGHGIGGKDIPIMVRLARGQTLE